MSVYNVLLTELDRCEYIVDYEYKGSLEDYTYNGITYAQSSITYYSILLSLYRDFLYEWTKLSDTEKSVVRRLFGEIKNKRYITDYFFFDVPTKEIVQGMINDRVPRKDIEMARFIYDMAQQQCYFLTEVMCFLEEDTKLTQPSELKETDVEAAINLLADYPDILSTSDVAAIFDKTEHTIREWERTGKLINVAEDANDDKDVNSNGHRKRRKALQFRKCDIITDMNLRKMLVERLS